MLATAIAVDPHPAWILPFVVLLLCIAILPLVWPRFWEHHYVKICLGLGLLPVGYYLFGLRAPGRLLTVAGDYVSFIVSIGSLYVVAGGIHVRSRGEATPSRNLIFLMGGALLGNLVGTTGASMLLIRPWIRLNRYRYTDYHTAFFIFLISNVGGCLTPIGPPLFLGYLKGIPFWWITPRTFPAWALAVGALGLLFYALDRVNFLAIPRALREKITVRKGMRFAGLANLGWLALNLGAVFLRHPIGARELLMLAAALGSYGTTARSIHEANHFSFDPIREVAWLFAGIFATLVPALDYLEAHAATLGITTPLQFYWTTGLLSDLLDNAPTYLAFLTAAMGLEHLQIENSAHVAQYLHGHAAYVLAVSLGSVFFGAATYLGNGPNLMVKAIAQEQGVHTPHFFQYIYAFSLPLLLPVLALVGWVFLARA